jgi:hypothetical protein
MEPTAPFLSASDRSVRSKSQRTVALVLSVLIWIAKSIDLALLR